jgi:hypothetical protein
LERISPCSQGGNGLPERMSCVSNVSQEVAV